MAEAMDSIHCSICLDALKDPVTTACGHSYCMDCINSHWNKDDQKPTVYRCPLCNESFFPRPVLRKNTLLAELVEKLKTTTLKVAQCYAGPGDVECDVCSGTKLKATKSCLVCLASYCETHLQPHYESTAFKRHKLVNASTKLQERICLHHDKPLEVYCCTDQQGICCLCVMDEHKGHDTVSAAAGRTWRQMLQIQLHGKIQSNRFELQQREEKVQEVKKAKETVKISAKEALKHSDKIFAEVIHSLKRRCTEVRELIRAQEKAEVSQAEELLGRLEQEVAELRRRDAELEQLSHTKNDIHFLQSFQSLSISSGSDVSPSITGDPQISFEHVNTFVSELKDRIQEIGKLEIAKISQRVTEIKVDLPTIPLDELPEYSLQLTLDPNTANEHLCLSEENRKLTRTQIGNSYPAHPERFSHLRQVLCKESLSGAYVWEVEWSGSRVDVAVSYKGIDKKGSRSSSIFGRNDQSWSLVCKKDSTCSFFHNKNKTEISVPCSSRIRVYLDHRAGTLDFYKVSHTMTLLHQFQTTFTQPLYPGFGVYGSHSFVQIL